MIADLVVEKHYTIEEYFIMEERANCKSEFRNGKIFKMLEGTYSHSKIGLNIAIASSNVIGDDNYEVVSNDHAIYIPKYNHFVYSDTCVIKGEPEFHKGRNQGILNPTVIFEVFSSSTEKYDRFGKFNKYKTIPTFTEYVLVDQEMPVVEVFSKNELGWQQNVFIGLEDTIKLQAIGYELKMVDIYKRVKGLLDPQAILEL